MCVLIDISQATVPQISTLTYLLITSYVFSSLTVCLVRSSTPHTIIVCTGYTAHCADSPQCLSTQRSELHFISLSVLRSAARPMLYPGWRLLRVVVDGRAR